MAIVVKNLPANAGDVRDLGLILESGRYPAGGHDNPLQYSCLENPIWILAGYSPWGCKESDMPEQLSTHNYTRFPQIIWRKLPMIIMMDIDAQLISLLRLP